MLTIRPATVHDAPALAELGLRTFVDAFGSQNRPEDIADYLAKTYGVHQQTREIEKPHGITLLGFDDETLIAFAQMRHAPTEHGEIEIARFYVDRGHHGRGIARSLMDECVEFARSRGASAIWLGVWEHNPRAIRFYEKCGFRDVGSHPFLLGSDLQTDRLMRRDLR